MGNSSTVELLKLATELRDAKRDENEAKARRVAAEEEITRLLDFKLGEGSETYEYEGPEGACKVALKRPVTRSVDTDTWERIRKDLPRALAKSLMRAKYELNMKEARKLEEDQPGTWAKVAEAVSSKPGKIGVEIKSIEIIQGA